MKVIVLTTSFPVRAGSVSGIFVAHLVNHLTAGVDVTVLTPADAEPVPRLRRGRTTIVPCRYAPQRWQRLAHAPGGIPVALRSNPWMYLLLPGLLLSLFAHCLRETRSGDIIHANWAICGCIAGIAGRLLRVPVVTTLRGEDVTRAEVSAPDRLLLRLCLRLSRRIVTVSSDMRRRLSERFPQHRDKLVMIDNGVDDAFLSAGAARTINTAADAGVVRLVTVGSLIPRKGIDRILHAMQQTGDLQVEFTIVGAGPEEAALKDIVASAGLGERVRFIGGVAAADVPRHLAAADVFVLASHSEGRPNVVLEAMAVGLPVIASDIPGVGEVVEHGGTGLLFADRNVAQLAQCIRTLVSDAGLRRRFGAAGRQAILQRGLTWPNCAGRYLELYRLLRGGR